MKSNKKGIINVNVLYYLYGLMNVPLRYVQNITESDISRDSLQFVQELLFRVFSM